MQATSHKRGDTFRYQVKHTVAGVVEPTTGWTIACQIRDSAGSLVATPTVVERDDAAGLFELLVANTTAWPIGTLRLDVQYTLPDGDIVSTPTVYVPVVEDITRS